VLATNVFCTESAATGTEVSHLYRRWDECGFKSLFSGCPNIHQVLWHEA